MSSNQERPVRISARQAAQMVDGAAGAVLPFLVEYHGSLVTLHGEAWHVGDCLCTSCIGTGWAVRRSVLVTLAGDVLSHVGPTSWTPVVEDLPCLHPDPQGGEAPCPGCGRTKH